MQMGQENRCKGGFITNGRCRQRHAEIQDAEGWKLPSDCSNRQDDLIIRTTWRKGYKASAVREMVAA